MLETLLLFYADASKVWNSQSLALELRSNPSSIEKRLAVLKNLDLIVPDSRLENGFCFQTNNVVLKNLMEELSLAYRVHRHRVLEIIFSPSKKAKDFANAFRVAGHKIQSEGEEDG